MRMILQMDHKFGEYFHVSIWYLRKEQFYWSISSEYLLSVPNE